MGNKSSWALDEKGLLSIREQNDATRTLNLSSMFTGCPKIKWLSECCWSLKIVTRVLRGQIFPWTWIGSAWSYFVFSKKRPKIIISRNSLVQVQLRGVSATGDWAGTPWLQQHFESHSFKTPCRFVWLICLKYPSCRACTSLEQFVTWDLGSPPREPEALESERDISR